MRPWSAGFLIVLLVIVAPACERGQSVKTVEGRVYRRFDSVRGPTDPIVGVTISNNWDHTTARTDSTGRFVMRVKRVAPDECVILRIDIAGRAACLRLAGTSSDIFNVQIFFDGAQGTALGDRLCQSS